MENQKKAYGFAITAILLWSTVATAFKIGLSIAHPFQLLFYSSVVSFICLGIVLLMQGRFFQSFHLTGKQLANSALTGLFNPFLYYVVLLTAYSQLPAQIAQPLNYTWPIVLVILSAPFMKQKIRWKSLMALGVSFFGVMIISAQGNVSGFHIEKPFAIILASGSSIIWAVYWLLNARDPRDSVQKLFVGFFFGVLFTGILAAFTCGFTFPLKIQALSFIYVGLFEMGLTFVFWLTAMKLTERNDKISNLVYISPFVSLILIHFILGETIYSTTLIGLVLIIAGIFIQQMKGTNFSKKQK